MARRRPCRLLLRCLGDKIRHNGILSDISCGHEYRMMASAYRG
jgi:hypothetical protein